MSEPRRLLDDPGSPEARLLASALEDPPPPDLLARALGAAGAAAVGARVAASPTPTSAAAAAKGIWGAVGIGALAGVLTVGAVELASGRSTPPRVPAAASASVVTSASPVRPGAPTAPADTAEKASAGPTRAGRRAEASSSPSSARPSSLAAELALLDEVRVTLHGGDPARARALLDRYAREIPRGQMAREAGLLRAEVDAALDGGTSNP